jgi:feruloyl esterase
MWGKFAGLMRTGDFAPASRPATALVETPFAPNPGNLRMFCHLPRGLAAGAPLVAILHGCGQTAAGYTLGAGWSQLADRLGFAVLAPEQKAANNPATCFNWFNPDDVRRGEGEVHSIAVMIRQMLERHHLDPARVFITGLSAGGAMAAAMLAAYPEMFAGGAIIAGLPVGAAANAAEALAAMQAAPLRTPRAWGDAVRAASGHRGPWPKISIWHGALDSRVHIGNAQASVAQWADLHGLRLTDARQDKVKGAIRLRWGDRLEVITVPALGHGTPIDSADLGAPAAHILEAGISSSAEIAAFWGLGRAASTQADATAAEGLIRRALKAVGLRG